MDPDDVDFEDETEWSSRFVLMLARGRGLYDPRFGFVTLLIGGVIAAGPAMIRSRSSHELPKENR